MRIRSIRPEFWSSEDIAAMDWHTRLVYIGLWSYVDDNGVGRDVERLIVTALFPLDDDLSEASVRVHGALKHLETAKNITRYTVDGRPYLHITAWERHQKINRASEGRYPLPTSKNAEIHGPLSEPSVSPHADSPLGEGEKGRRGEDTHAHSRAPRVSAEDFEAWWSHWPKKVGKKKAREHFTPAVRELGLDTLIAKTDEWIKKFDASGSERRFIPDPERWLKHKRWEDDFNVGSPDQSDIPSFWRDQ